ncbi:MAG: ATP-binding protein [bacterium]|nr:ATP-binding protein [bacterium]MCY4258473.1 ATP-binding protein [bacterium]
MPPPPTAAIQQVIAEQNPWRRDGQVPRPFAPPVERPLARHLWQRLLSYEPRRYQLILGPRRVGKTTALYQTVARLLANGVDSSRILWLRLDHPVLLREELGTLARLAVESSGASRENPVFLMLDELVYAQSWDIWLKTFYDEQWPIQIAATSSAAAALHRGRLESGVGRWEEQHMMPYSFTEFLDLIIEDNSLNWARFAGQTLSQTIESLLVSLDQFEDLTDIRRRLLMTGGFPELLNRAAASLDTGYENTEADLLLYSQQALRPDAVERAIYKDIPQSFGLDNPMMLERMLYVLADQVAGLVSAANISNDLGVSVPTIERYLTYLEHAFLIFMLPNYSGTESAKQRRGRKLYFIDGAVRNAALQRGLAVLDNASDMGHLLENLVAASLRILTIQAGISLYHWREGKQEVDLIYDDPQRPIAFEVASSADHRRGGLEALITRHPRFFGNSYLVAPGAPTMSAQSNANGIGSLPLNTLLIAVGAQTHQAMMHRLRAH